MNIERKKSAIVPTNDYVFKRIFGQVGNEEITKGLISSIIGKEIETIDLDGNTILTKDIFDDKLGILDIKAKFNTDVICDIEMQVENRQGIEKRILYYWSKLYAKQINSGKDYPKLKQTISIMIAKFEMKEFRNIKKFHTEWQIREKDYRKTILTDILEIHIIELPKLEKMLEQRKISEKDKKLAICSKFLLKPESMEEKEMKENSDIQKAKEELDKMKRDEYEERLAELREKAMMDEKAIRAYGYEEGRLEIVEKVIKNELTIDDILEITSKTIEEIEEITGLTKEELEKI